MIRVGYLGWCGYRNIGDEVCLAAIKDLLPKADIYVAVGPNWDYKQKIDLFVFGGGTLLYLPGDAWTNVLSYYTEKGVPAVVWGTGVLPKTAPCSPKVISALRKAAFVGVRGPCSYQRLTEKGFSTGQVIGDPGLTVSSNAEWCARSKTVALNLGNLTVQAYSTKEKMLELTRSLLTNLSNNGYTITLFSMQPQDQPDLEALKDFANVAIREYDPSWESLITFFRQCFCVIGMRLHSSVLAAAAAVPFISLGYHEKCYDFAYSVGMERFVVRTDDQDLPLKIMELINFLRVSESEIHDTLLARVADYKKRHLTLSTKVSSILG